MPYRKVQPVEAGETKKAEIWLNAKLHNRILDIANSRYRNFSSTARLLLNMGLDAYETNQLEGNTTAKKASAAAGERRAKAEATAARRQAEKERKEAAARARKGKPQGQSKDAGKAQQSGAGVPLLVPLGFENDDEV